MRWTGHVACTGNRRDTGFWWGDLMERAHFEELGVDRRIILIWIFKKWDGKVWTGWLWLRIETCDALL
jgi:hypothetical protein